MSTRGRCDLCAGIHYFNLQYSRLIEGPPKACFVPLYVESRFTIQRETVYYDGRGCPFFFFLGEDTLFWPTTVYISVMSVSE